ncbi:class I SAM-dependent methyltransferase [Rossellomorea aquimaris]|uniref:class I SAM-dependent methyltransferase n=1 Tax=Rossellomorea aquimaris TaxID=189382 RepID=UPI0007D04E1D|nr:class I SAM-dependent methyltransferase [Rossellomorea aquimaris]
MGEIKKQYQNSSNLQMRINIHDLYSTNKKDWHSWLFEQYDIPPKAQILEIGCGNGLFWLKNKHRVPEQWTITLSDFSAGMIEDAKQQLVGMPNIQYNQINIEDIPYDTNQFDAVIANHMLYHVQDKQLGIQEVRRVLKPGGVFYSSTIGDTHMMELGELLKEFDPTLNYSSALNHSKAFGVENGAEHLKSQFEEVNLKMFPGNLKVTDVQGIVDYLLSTHTDLKNRLVEKKLAEFIRFLEEKRVRNDGVIHVTKSTGLFESR